MGSPANEPKDGAREPRASLDIFSPGPGFALAGAGLLALAAVEAVKLAALAPSSGAAALHASTLPEPGLGNAEPAPQSAVGTGPGSPKPRSDGAPPASGQLVGLAANPIPNGTALYRLWSSGRVEAMITTEDNIWGEWMVVAPGISTDMRRPKPPESPENPE